MSKASIKIEGLTKHYSGADKFALKDLSLTVAPGEIYGFLGPNGAGKSTTIRLLMNFIQPTRGRAELLGKDVVRNSVELKSYIGYLSGENAMYPKLTGAQYLSYMNDLQVSNSKRNAEKLAKKLGADLNKKINDLSTGNKQKIAIIQAFMHNPKILILDEPTRGLDPLMQEAFYELLVDAKKRGATIFMSSHILGEIQKTCDRVGIIREGRLVSESVISDLAAEAAQTFDIEFGSKVPLGEIRKVLGVRVQNKEGKRVTINMHGKLSDLFAVLARHEVTRIEARTLDLEDLFMQYYEGRDKKK